DRVAAQRLLLGEPAPDTVVNCLADSMETRLFCLRTLNAFIRFRTFCSNHVVPNVLGIRRGSSAESERDISLSIGAATAKARLAPGCDLSVGRAVEGYTTSSGRLGRQEARCST